LTASGEEGRELGLVFSDKIEYNKRETHNHCINSERKGETHETAK
jgi:hypothetical protein